MRQDSTSLTKDNMANKHHIVTPIGIAVMPFLFEEDPEYNNYKVSIRVDMKTAEKFKADLLSALKGEQFTTKSPHIPIVEDTREEGMFLIRTASKHKPRVFDSKNNPIPVNTKVGGGSEVRALCEVHKWDVQKKEGIKLRLKEVQVVKLSEGGASHFDQIEDGFEVDTGESETSGFDS